MTRPLYLKMRAPYNSMPSILYSAVKRSIGSTTGCTIKEKAPTYRGVLNVKALVGAFNQEKALVGAFSVIVQPVVEPMEHYTALVITPRPATALPYIW